MEMWEKWLVGAFTVLIVLWFYPGVKTMLSRSQEAEKDWPAVIIPLILVVGFILLLITILRV